MKMEQTYENEYKFLLFVFKYCKEYFRYNFKLEFDVAVELFLYKCKRKPVLANPNAV